jgi:hypothetical protein
MNLLKSPLIFIYIYIYKNIRIYILYNIYNIYRKHITMLMGNATQDIPDLRVLLC